MIITISRQAATNGGLIGRLVAERLGLRVFDREVVDEITRRTQIEPNVVNPFDEAVLSPVQSILWEWRNSINERIYGRYLRQALKRIADEDNAVIIGRGANFVLRCARCLHVRIIAPLALRIGIYRTAFPDVPDEEAAKRIHTEDRNKARFVRAVFHEDIDDPRHYDLVLNLAGLTPETSIELIATAANSREERKLPPESQATLPNHVRIMSRHRRPARPGVVEHYRFKP